MLINLENNIRGIQMPCQKHRFKLSSISGGIDPEVLQYAQYNLVKLKIKEKLHKNKLILYIDQIISDSENNANKLLNHFKCFSPDILIDQFDYEDENKIVNTIKLINCKYKSTNYDLDYSTGQPCTYKIELKFHRIEF